MLAQVQCFLLASLFALSDVYQLNIWGWSWGVSFRRLFPLQRHLFINMPTYIVKLSTSTHTASHEFVLPTTS